MKKYLLIALCMFGVSLASSAQDETKVKTGDYKTAMDFTLDYYGRAPLHNFDLAFARDITKESFAKVKAQYQLNEGKGVKDNFGIQVGFGVQKRLLLGDFILQGRINPFIGCYRDFNLKHTEVTYGMEGHVQAGACLIKTETARYYFAVGYSVMAPKFKTHELLDDPANARWNIGLIVVM